MAIKYKNLKAEMIRKSVSNGKMAEVLGVTEQTFRRKLTGDVSVTIDEAQSNVFLSAVYDSQKPAEQILTDIADIANSIFVWSQNQLKIVPLGDSEIKANGMKWTPNLTPIYDITEDDILQDEEAVVCERTQQADVYNSVKVEYLNRANDYNVEVVEAQDLADIELHGLRVADTLTAHQICTGEVAQRTAQLALERKLALRNKYKFKLPFDTQSPPKYRIYLLYFVFWF